MNQLDDIYPPPTLFLSDLTNAQADILADGKFQIIRRHVRKYPAAAWYVPRHLWYELSTENEIIILKDIFWSKDDARESIISEAQYLLALRHTMKRLK